MCVERIVSVYTNRRMLANLDEAVLLCHVNVNLAGLYVCCSASIQVRELQVLFRNECGYLLSKLELYCFNEVNSYIGKFLMSFILHLYLSFFNSR